MSITRTTNKIRAEMARLASAAALAQVRAARSKRKSPVQSAVRRWKYDPTTNARPVSRKEYMALRRRRSTYYL